MYKLKEHNDNVIFTDTIENLSLSIPKKQFAGMVTPMEMPCIADERVFENAICRPEYGETLYHLAKAKNAKSASIIVSDVTRNVPTKRVVRYLLNELMRAGIEEENILFIIALGVHRPATEIEMAEIIGEKLYASEHSFRVINHDPWDKEQLVNLGKTSYGTKVEVNKEAYECNLHINIGKVEPHEFAGFSGGRKSVMPGISSAESIIANHSPIMLSSPYAIPGNLMDNPIHMDMLECAGLYGIDFSVNFVVNNQSEPVAVFTGDLVKAHQAAVDFLYEKIAVTFKKPDIIITSPGYPLNIEFYQAVKPLIALTDMLDQDIVVVIYSECPEGINSEDMMRAFRHSAKLDEIKDFVIQNYKIQMDHVLLLSKILDKQVKIIVYSPNLDASDIEAMHMIPCQSQEELIPLAASLSGKENPQILIFPQAQKYLVK